MALTKVAKLVTCSMPSITYKQTVSPTSYQYIGKNETCDIEKTKNIAARIASYESVPSNSEEALQKAVSMQPVTAGIEGGGMAFRHYSSGVFSGGCGMSLDHGVTVVGFGENEYGIEYWLVKYSWGQNWGEGGYMRIRKNVGFPQGLCGIAMYASYPVVQPSLGIWLYMY
ncbi:zingipain-2-like [Prunus yedoensis var. nudiflora]|uniref:Zingipain-2-like n=1 Tax=Prunus yedoensis var. nudiflora TaxID=2094558 RepID=A0A314YEB6_PRUYE|nr:zingipain-2-like [Prunus yedoensis var. nudiflora]